MQTQIVLTPSQSKRLIAKGIKAWEPVRQAMRNGLVAVGKGTTNSYVVEELLGEAFDKTRYCFGRVGPAGASTDWLKGDAKDVVFEKGVRVEGMTVLDAVPRMKGGDVFLKGANAINYDLGQAAILIAHPSGGTMGGSLGGLVSRRVRLVHPVGLEKSVPGDLLATARRMADETVTLGEGGPDALKRALAHGEPAKDAPAAPECYGLWVSQGELFTEIEALETLFDLEAIAIAAGGVAGAEGAVTIALFGNKGELEKALALIADIQKEQPLGPTK